MSKQFITIDTQSIFLNNAICFDLRKSVSGSFKDSNGNIIYYYTYSIFFSFKKRVKKGVGYGKTIADGNVYFELELPVAFTFFNILHDVCENGEDSVYIRPIRKYQYDGYGKVIGSTLHKTKNVENDYGITCYQGMTSPDNIRKKNYRIQYQTNNNERKISISVSESGGNQHTVNITTELAMGLTIAKLGLGLCNKGQYKV